MTFADPYYSLLLIVIPLLLTLFFGWASAVLLPKIVDRVNLKLRSQQWVLRIFGLLFICLALCGPQWGYHWQNIPYNTREIIFAHCS